MKQGQIRKISRAISIMGLLGLMAFNLGDLRAGDIQFNGLVQTWFSFTDKESSDAEDQIYGFGIKRLEFNPHGSFSENMNWGFMVGWDNDEFRLFDSFLDTKFSPTFNVKLGRFSVPGTVSASLSPSGSLDLIERAAITMHWGENNALFGERSWGIQSYGTFVQEKLFYAVMVANQGLLGDSFTPSIKSANHEFENAGLYLWGRLEARLFEGWRCGAFLGEGEDEKTDLKRSSYGAHVFYRNQKINLKMEYIGGENTAPNIETLEYSGMYGIAGYSIGKIESVIRFDYVSPNGGNPDAFGVEKYENLTAGLNYSYNEHIRFQVNYVSKGESMSPGLDELENDIFYLNCQYSY